MTEKKLNLRYGEECGILLEGLPRTGIYAGYNINEEAHIILVRNPNNQQDIIPLKSQRLKINERLSYLDKVLTSSENEFANNLLKQVGI